MINSAFSIVEYLMFIHTLFNRGIGYRVQGAGMGMFIVVLIRLE